MAEFGFAFMVVGVAWAIAWARVCRIRAETSRDTVEMKLESARGNQ